jgi:hypothetical protein
MKTSIASLLAALTLLPGCMTHNLTTFTKALAGDPATVMVDLRSVYGTLRFVRTNPGTNQSAVVSPDGTVTVRWNAVPSGPLIQTFKLTPVEAAP